MAVAGCPTVVQPQQLLILSLQFKKIVQLAAADDRPSDPQIELWSAKATELEREAARALETWLFEIVQSSAFSTEPGMTVWKECTSLIVELEQDRKQMSLLLATAEQLCYLQMCDMLIRDATAIQPRGKCMHWLTGYLTAGPSELHNYELALRLAQTAVEAFPDDQMAKQNLAWALFRTGRWEDALELLLPDEVDQHEAKSVGANGAMIAMCYWHLGERIEAARWLENSPAAIDAHLQLCEEHAAKEEPFYPTPSMVKSLLEESTKLLQSDLEPQGS